jgi:hypothetical protein
VAFLSVLFPLLALALHPSGCGLVSDSVAISRDIAFVLCVCTLSQDLELLFTRVGAENA